MRASLFHGSVAHGAPSASSEYLAISAGPSGPGSDMPRTVSNRSLAAGRGATASSSWRRRWAPDCRALDRSVGWRHAVSGSGPRNSNADREADCHGQSGPPMQPTQAVALVRCGSLPRDTVVTLAGASEALPLASMYQEVWCQAPAKAGRGETERDAQRRATILTNALIDRGAAVEINVIADRVTIVHAPLAPALIALRRRGADPDDLALPDTARRVLAFVLGEPRPTAGQVRVVPRRSAQDVAEPRQRRAGRAAALPADRPRRCRRPRCGRAVSREGRHPVPRVRSHPPRPGPRRGSADGRRGGEPADRRVSPRRGVRAEQQVGVDVQSCVSRAELDAAIDPLAANGRVEVDGKTAVEVTGAACAPAGPRAPGRRRP